MSIITIVAPIKFQDEIMKEYTRLSAAGDIVFLPVFERTNVDELALMNLHKAKILMSDSVHVVNVGGYMGRGTYEEVGFAYINGKNISFYEDLNKAV